MAKITIAQVQAANPGMTGVGQMSQAERSAAIAAASAPPPAQSTPTQVQPTADSVKGLLGVSSGFGSSVVSQSEISSIAASINAGTPITVSGVGSSEANRAIAEYNSQFFDKYKGMTDAQLTTAAKDLMKDLNLAGYKGEEDHSKGFSVDSVKTYLESGGTKGGAGVIRTLPRLQGLMSTYEDVGYLTADQINSGGDTLKALNQTKYPGLFALTYGDTGGSDKSFTTEYYKKDEKGNYIPVGTGKTVDRTNPESGLVGGLLSLASIIPSPIQPFALAANSIYQASQGNYLSAVLSALGANASFSGVDSAVLADAKSLADQGLSMSQIAETLGKTYDLNQVASLTTAVGGTIASGVGGLWDKATGTITDAAGNVIGDADKVTSGIDSGSITLPSGSGSEIGYDTAGNILPEGVPDGAQNIGDGVYTSGGKVYDTFGDKVYDIYTGTGAGADPTGLGTAEGWVKQLIDKGLTPEKAATLAATWAGAGYTADQVTGFMENVTADGTVNVPDYGTGGGSGGGTGGGTGTGGTTTTPPVNWGDPSTWDWKTILGTGTGLLGDYLTGKAASDAAKTQAETQLKIAEMMRFKPVGVTTRFGESKFGYDDKGNLTSAGYQLAPDVKAQQDSLMAAAPGMLSQFTGSVAATAPMSTAAQRAMTLGNSYLATTPQEQAAKFMAEQNALLDPGNKAELANLQNKLQAQGRLGLSIGGEGGLMGTNPEMAAYQNKLEMQQRQLAAQSTLGGQQYANYGMGLVGSGGQMLQDMYGTQTAAYNPYQTAMNGANQLEGLGQNAMDIGTKLGAQQSTANTSAGNMMNNAASTMADVNKVSPWGNLLTSAGGLLNQYNQPQGTTYDPSKYRLTPII